MTVLASEIAMGVLVLFTALDVGGRVFRAVCRNRGWRWCNEPS